MTLLDARYWEQRYQEEQTPWDLGCAATPLTHYLKDKNRDLEILIPGAGRAYEAEWLIKEGFTAISVIDFSPKAVADAQARFSESKQVTWIVGDFFRHEGHYDLIVEQTFFCALQPQLRTAYVLSMKSLLKPGGILMGVLFNFPLTDQGPPFGGSEGEYRQLFEGAFQILHLESCLNSIKPRLGSEFFLELKA
jgi:SAM-dependent methyltransferase